MTPDPWARMVGSTARIMRTVPKTLVSKMLRTRSSARHSRAPQCSTPALLTSTSMRPSACDDLVDRGRTEASSVTSSGSNSTASCPRPPPGRQGIGLGQVAHGGVDPIALAGEGQGGGQAEAAAATGDDDDGHGHSPHSDDPAILPGPVEGRGSAAFTARKRCRHASPVPWRGQIDRGLGARGAAREPAERHAHPSNEERPMSGSKARLSAIDAVKGYETPAGFFPPPEGPGRDLRRQRLHQGGDAEAAAQARLQVGDGDHRALQAARPGGGRRGGRGHEGLGDGEGRHPLRPRLLPAHPPHRREARQLPRAGRRRLVDRRVPGQDPHPGRAGRVQLPERGPARHLRGPGLHRLGRDQPRLHPGEPQRQHACASPPSSSR